MHLGEYECPPFLSDYKERLAYFKALASDGKVTEMVEISQRVPRVDWGEVSLGI